MKRRTLLRAGLAAPLSLGLIGPARWALGQASFSNTPFTLGVAAGSPTVDGFVIWTRLAPAPLEGGGMPDALINLRWELASDADFREPLRTGWVLTRPELAHSAHVELSGLEPGRSYWYRFTLGSWVSPIGRAATLPAADSMPSRLRVAFASCQHFEEGHFGAYRHMYRDAPDWVIFLGDYIYEYGGRPSRVRRHTGGEARTLADYRNRHAQYKTDPDLQRMHAAAPWLLTWDDHEVANDYARDQSGDMSPEFPSRRAAAYQAYYEHMPLRHAAWRAGGSELRLYGSHAFGRLAHVHLLDCRQYRSHQACPRPGRGGGQVVVANHCAELNTPSRSFLGHEQEAWLERALAESGAVWDVLGQSTLLSPAAIATAGDRRVWTDGWDGYPAARARLLGWLAARPERNAIVLGGDVHSAWAADLKKDFGQAGARAIASEFCGTSVTSRSRLTREMVAVILRDNPHLHFADPEHRGYAILDIDRARAQVTFRGLENVADPDTAVRTLARFEVRAGTPGTRRADVVG